jgi:hypothetical protein
VQALNVLSTEELQALVNRARRFLLAQRKLEEGCRRRAGDSCREGDTRYLLEYVRCGKASAGQCRKCREGEYHGLYWYSYIRNERKTVSKYHGKDRPGGPTTQRGEEVSDARHQRSGA